MNAVENDPETQRNGIVIILYYVDSSAQEHRAYLRNLVAMGKDVYQSIPYKSVCTHMCYSNSVLRTCLNLTKSNASQTFSKVLRLYSQTDLKERFREHCGGHIEARHCLLGFGISPSGLTVDPIGRLKADFVENYIEKQRVREEQMRIREGAERGNTMCSRIDTASDEDVLLGRGRPCQLHPGNVKLADIVKEYLV